MYHFTSSRKLTFIPIVVENQVDRFLRELVTVFDANKDDEKKKFRDLMGRYEDK
jgi:hypothetical protein